MPSTVQFNKEWKREKQIDIFSISPEEAALLTPDELKTRLKETLDLLTPKQ